MAVIKNIGSMDLERGWPYGSHTWKPGMDRNLVKLAFMTNGSAISRTDGIPLTGNPGDCHIDPDTGEVVIWEEDDDGVMKWLGITPSLGAMMYVEDEEIVVGYIGSPATWEVVFDPDAAVPAPVPRSVAMYFPGPVIPNLTVFASAIRVSVDFAADFAGSYGYSDATAEADTTFTVSKNGVDFGSITFPTGLQTATFSGTAQSFVEGDIIRVQSPGTLNGLANVAITLKGLTPGL